MKELEEKIWYLIKEAEKNRDLKKLSELSNIAQEFDRIKQEQKKIREKIKRIEESTYNDITEGRFIYLTVSEGSIRQNLLLITELKKKDLVPPDEEEFEVETEIQGLIFKTDIPYNRNCLRERGKIAEFYRKAGIKAGDQIIWREIGPRKYHLSKA